MNSLTKLIIGFVGVLFFGAGGYVLFEGLFQLSYNQGRWIGDYAFSGWGFGAFLLIGFGFWLIVMSGQLETKQPPS
jgi:hypothetical protein